MADEYAEYGDDADEAAELTAMIKAEQEQSHRNGAPSLGDAPAPQQPAAAFGAPFGSGAKKPEPKLTPIRQELIAAYPDGQTAVVARHMVMSNGVREIQETWRPPTAEESRLFAPDNRAVQILSGGLAASASGAGWNWKPWAIGGAAVLAVGGLAWWKWDEIQAAFGGGLVEVEEE